MNFINIITTHIALSCLSEYKTIFIKIKQINRNSLIINVLVDDKLNCKTSHF